MEMLVLETKVRSKDQTAKSVRSQNLIPAIVYGKGFENHSIELEYQTFRKAYIKASTTQVITLDVAGKKLPVLIHQIDYNPVTDRFDHVDFLQIDITKKVTATVPVEIVGTAPAVKNFNGVITVSKHEVEVRCLPMDIPHEIKVDVSKLENLGDAIHLSEIDLGGKVEILDDLESTLVTVNAVEEYVENTVDVPEELKAEPTATEGGEAAPAAEKGEDKAE